MSIAVSAASRFGGRRLVLMAIVVVLFVVAGRLAFGHLAAASADDEYVTRPRQIALSAVNPDQDAAHGQAALAPEAGFVDQENPVVTDDPSRPVESPSRRQRPTIGLALRPE